MLIKFLKDEDFTNYRKPSMFIGFPYCDFKCNRDSGKEVCQNMSLIKEPNIEIEPDTIVNRYIENSITCAIVMGGLEPFNSYEDLYSLIKGLREKTNDDIVIYTGYYASEIMDKIIELKQFKNIIIKFGRYFPGDTSHYEPLLGVHLASDGQYAVNLNEY
jgi:organic radical activating enzyme